MMDERRLKEIRGRLDAAGTADDLNWSTDTPLGWDDGPYYFVCDQNGIEAVRTRVGAEELAEFIAHAPRDIADLLDELDKANKACRLLGEIIDRQAES